MRGAGIALAALGLAQMAATAVGCDALRGLAAATAASPAPRVFSSVGGLETFSTRFFLAWTDPDGRPRRLALTPEVYARLPGPYNRRNAYGAVVAYGPVLATSPATQPLFAAVARFALCPGSPLLRDLGVVPGGHARARIVLEPRAGATLGDMPLVLEASCP